MINLLEADRLAEVSQELRRYYVSQKYGGYTLVYHGVNESSFVENGKRHEILGYAGASYLIPTFNTEDEAWAQLPDDLKAYRETLR